MNEKPEALRLAERIDLRDYYDFDAALHCPDAAIQLRRLHAENERLREALEKIATVNAMDYEYVRWAKAALRREDV